MLECIATSFDTNDWNEYGASFIGSLCEFANFGGKVLVVEIGLPYKVKFRLKQYGVSVINGTPKYGKGIDRLLAVSKYLKQDQDQKYITYWSPEVYFQGPVDDAFSKDKLGYCIDKNEYNQPIRPSTAFLTAPCKLWATFGDFLEFAAQRNESAQTALTAFVRCFKGLTKQMPDTWSYSSIGDLRWENGFHNKNGLVKVMHLSGINKVTEDGKQYSFKRNYKDAYDLWHNYIIMGNQTSARGLLKKSAKHIFAKK